jgi:type IV pilus assembly protein PilE
MKTVRETSGMQRGFTLIELMVVVAIVAILAAIAVPSYQRHIVKTNRQDAMAVLQSAAQAMERYYAKHNNDYTDAEAGKDFPNQAPVDGIAKYDVQFDGTPDLTSYKLRAIPKGSQAGDGYIQIDQTGLRTWDKNNNNAIDAGESTWNDH